MPRTSLAAIVLLLSVLLGASSSLGQSPVIGEVPRIKVLVLPFQVNADAELSYLQSGLPRLLADQLAEMGFEVVPLDRMSQLLEEQQVEFIDLNTARDMALLAGAEFSVYGSFSQVGETISLDARLTEAFGLQPAKALFVSKEGIINVLPAVEELAGKVRLELLAQEEVTEIEVRGLAFLDEDVILLRMQTQPGELFDPAMVNKDLRAIYDLGYFDDVKIAIDDAPGGKRLIVVVEEKPRIGVVTVEGNEELDDDDVLEVMTTKAGGVLNLSILAEDLVLVRELYRKEGYYRAKVDYKLEGGEGGQAGLTLMVEEGPELYIESIEIRGAEQADVGDIKDELALSERGMFSFLTDSGVLEDNMLERDTAALEAYYANNGFLDAKVGKPEVEYREDGIYIIFNVSEGPRYTVNSLSFEGDLIYDEELMYSSAKMDDYAEEGKFLDRSVVREDLQRLTDNYANFGYAFADANLNLRKVPGENTVDLVYVMSKNQKVRVRRLLIEGNTKTRDNVILREMRLADGDTFSGFLLNRSEQRLNKLDYFEEVEIEAIPTTQDDLLDLKIRVKEKSTGMLSAGAGYSSYSNLFATATIQERNLFGKGYFLGFQGSFSGQGSTYSLSLTNPYLYDTRLSLGADLYLLDQEFIEFDRETIGGRVRVGYPLGEYTRVTGSYRLDHYNATDIDDDDAEVIRELEDRNWSSVFGIAAQRSTTNKPYLPTRGSDIAFSIEYGGGILQGDDDFIKLVGDYDYFHTVFWKLTFHFHTQVGRLLRNFTDESPPAFERFYLGGLNSIRGYEGRHISPRDEESDDRIGGTKSFYTNFEFIAPVIESQGLFGVVFFDAGNSWDEDESYFGPSDASVDELALGLFKSVGVGVRWLSPLGPLRLEYGFPLDDLRGSDSSGRFEFSMGTSF